MAINDPRDIPGLVFWGSAEHEAANYTDGQAMTVLTDLSGNGNDAPVTSGYSGPTWRSTGGASDGARMEFPGGYEHFLLPSMDAATAGEIHVTLQWVTGSPSTITLWRIGSDPGGNLYNYANGVREQFGSTALRSLFYPDAVWANWGRYSVTSGPGDMRAFFDGVEKYSLSTNTVGWHAQPTIGVLDTSYTMRGNFGAVILFDRQLTTTERADLNTWLVANPSGGDVESSVTVAGQSFTASIVANDGTALYAAPITVGGESFAATVSILDGTIAPYPLRVLGESFKITTSALDGVVVGAELRVVGEAFRVTTTTPDGTTLIDNPPPVAEASTDAVDRSNGRTRVCEWTVEIEPAVKVSPRDRGHDEVQTYSISGTTLVDGRPT